MIGDDSLWFDQLDGSQSIFGAHREVVADRQDGDVDTFLADQFHVVKQAGVASVVDRSVFGFQQNAARVAAV